MCLDPFARLPTDTQVGERERGTATGDSASPGSPGTTTSLLPAKDRSGSLHGCITAWWTDRVRSCKAGEVLGLPTYRTAVILGTLLASRRHPSAAAPMPRNLTPAEEVGTMSLERFPSRSDAPDAAAPRPGQATELGEAVKGLEAACVVPAKAQQRMPQRDRWRSTRRSA
jgi:hypothetical protein